MRAVEHLRAITADLGMAGVPQSLHLDVTKVEDGIFAATDADRQARQKVLLDLVRMARACRELRRAEAG